MKTPTEIFVDESGFLEIKNGEIAVMGFWEEKKLNDKSIVYIREDIAKKAIDEALCITDFYLPDRVDYLLNKAKNNDL